MDYVEFFIKKCEKLLPVDIKLFTDVAIQVLRYTYLKSENIFKGLAPMLHDDVDTDAVKVDYMLRGSSIVIAAVKIMNFDDWTIGTLIMKLTEVSCNEEHDIVILSNLIFGSIMME